MRASVEHSDVQVVAVNDPFIDLDYMVSNIFSCLILINSTHNNLVLLISH